MTEQEKEKYDDIWSSGTYQQSKTANVLSKSLFSDINPIVKLLDIGCGNGYFVSKLLDKGFDIYGVDITKSAWETHSETNPTFNVPKDRLVEAVANNMPFKNDLFDISFSVTLLEHLPEDIVDITIKEIIRVTKTRTVHYIDTNPKNKQVRDGYKLHLTLKPLSWWEHKFRLFNQKGITIVLKDKMEVV